MSNIRNISGTSWSVLKHSEKLYIFYNDKYKGLRFRNDTRSEEFHISLFIRPDGVDHHATWVYYDKYGRFNKRHYGYRFINGRQRFKSNSRPYYLRYLFNDFEQDIEWLDIPTRVLRLMVSLNFSNINVLFHFKNIRS